MALVHSYLALEDQPHRDLTGQVTKTQDHYFAYGGFSEVYKGEWKDRETGRVQQVAIKVLRGVHTNGEVQAAITKRLNRETKIWHDLSHPNILPFLGVCTDLGPSTAMVSPLCQNGAVLQYIEKRSDVNRVELVTGVARGLEYLHSKEVIHGDMKGHNVLMSDDGIPLLADFGRSKFIDHRGFTTSFAGSARYLAPELVSEEPDIIDSPSAYQAADLQSAAVNLTKMTDVFAFSMVALEIITGKIPYFYYRQDTSVIHFMQTGIRPERDRYSPTTFTDPIWTLLVDCWGKDPGQRPIMSQVVKRLEALP